MLRLLRLCLVFVAAAQRHHVRYAGTLAQRLLEIGGTPVLAQQIAERLVGELLKLLHLVMRQQVQRVPGLVVELNALAAHYRTSYLSVAPSLFVLTRLPPR